MKTYSHELVLCYVLNQIDDPDLLRSVEDAIQFDPETSKIYLDLMDAMYPAEEEVIDEDEPSNKTMVVRELSPSNRRRVVGVVGEFRVAASDAPRTGESPSTNTSISKDGQLLGFRIPLSDLEGFDPTIHCIKVNVNKRAALVEATIEGDWVVGSLRFSSLDPSGSGSFGDSWKYTYEVAYR